MQGDRKVLTYHHTGLDDPTLVAVSEDNVVFKSYNVPLQGHLALTDDPSEMV